MNKVFKQDTSLCKEKIKEKKQKLEFFSKVLAKNKQIGRDELATLTHSQLKTNAILKILINERKIQNLNLTFYDIPSTIFIQKHIRGWLCRKYYEKVGFI